MTHVKRVGAHGVREASTSTCHGQIGRAGTVTLWTAGTRAPFHACERRGSGGSAAHGTQRTCSHSAISDVSGGEAAAAAA